MSEPTLVLEYELTADRAKAEFRNNMNAQRRLWWKGLAAGIPLFIAGLFLGIGNYILATAFVVLAIEHWFSIIGRFVVGAWLRSSSFRPRCVLFELDDRGVVRRVPKQAAMRYSWKSLHRFSETEDCFDLNFGWQSLCVPQHAFADEDQRSTFRSLVARYLFRRNRLARECAKLDRHE